MSYRCIFRKERVVEHFSEEWDSVICIGPSDAALVKTLIPNVKERIAPRRIYVITLPTIKEQHQTLFDESVHWIDEGSFPFSIQDIHDKFHQKQRSGWYLQQLLKLYAPIVLPDLLDQYVIVDADVRIHSDLRFFKEGRIQFNVGTEYHVPYFEHMFRLLGMSKHGSHSGICHMMPMKRHIVQAFMKEVEARHGTEFWKAFLDKVDAGHYGLSGASEYELLYNYTQEHFGDEMDIAPLRWQNTGSPFANTSFDYEAYHWYQR